MWNSVKGYFLNLFILYEGLEFVKGTESMFFWRW